MPVDQCRGKGTRHQWYGRSCLRIRTSLWERYGLSRGHKPKPAADRLDMVVLVVALPPPPQEPHRSISDVGRSECSPSPMILLKLSDYRKSSTKSRCTRTHDGIDDRHSASVIFWPSVANRWGTLVPRSLLGWRLAAALVVLHLP